MSHTKEYIRQLFTNKQMNIAKERAALFDEFVKAENNDNAVRQILENQKKLMDNWKKACRIDDILKQHFTIPNGTVGKLYKAQIDFTQLNLEDVIVIEIAGLEAIGLVYDVENGTIAGTPTVSGDIKCMLKFKMQGEEENAVRNEKLITVIINPDPKTLWKKVPTNKDDQFWKEDEFAAYAELSDRKLVAASIRGRSHANAGSFREDDFAFAQYETGWSIIAVSDGAGSAKLSRQGSKIACNSIVEFFSKNLTVETDSEFEKLLQDYKADAGEENYKRINDFVYDNLSKGVKYVHKQIVDAAGKAEASLKDFHSTLIFTLFKKYEAGYAFLSFGVGDCPVALLNKDLTKVTMLNWIDVGEFGGGTRFITMPEIFNSPKFPSRFKFTLADDFSYLTLMTDGIYDPKFIVEANLEKIEKWRAFLEDLGGANEGNCKVQFEKANEDSPNQLLEWMNFWSAGNHDDRTLAVVF
jgi:serine/threonine protein phosphatase PrpC